jgi:hypothetical protein
MRFITEFELEYPFTLSAPKLCIERAKYRMGDMIESAFDRKEKEESIRGNEGRRWSLEIEAFPMDKWIEFKNRLLSHISFCNDEGRPVNEIRVLQMIKDLEFCVKPLTDEQSKTGSH